MAISLNPKRLFRFSIGTMLFAMLCVAGYFGGYRSGFDAGLHGGLCIKEYSVTDLIVSRNSSGDGNADFASLIDLVQTTVAPKSWLTNGEGRGTIQISKDHKTLFSREASVLVTQTQQVHDKIATVLDQLRKVQARTAVKWRPSEVGSSPIR